eukprot:TRINITY_DN1720_c0_g1_i1.p1 TRINITY_DN1720_c0_g1~~TRINITY_DN1720_c0_g1_i1.p1  ORF type:complete len:174 (-),score=26.78 TRINITY_DN1720_c0_g1_i1:119-640(-)
MISLCFGQLLALAALAAAEFPASQVTSHEDVSVMHEKASLLDQTFSDESFEEQYPPQQYPPQQYQQSPPQQYPPQQGYSYAPSRGYPAAQQYQAPQELGITEQDKLLPLNAGIKMHSDDSVLAGDKKPRWRERRQYDAPAIMEYIGAIYTSAATPGASCPWIPLLVLLALQRH